MLEQLLNGAEFSRDKTHKLNRKFLSHALELFRYMSNNSLIDGHACILPAQAYLMRDWQKM